MRTQLPKNKSVSGNVILKKQNAGKFTPGKAVKKRSDSAGYSKKEELKILNEFFTQPNYFED